MTTSIIITNHPGSHHDIKIETKLGEQLHPLRTLSPGQAHVDYIYSEKQLVITEVPLDTRSL